MTLNRSYKASSLGLSPASSVLATDLARFVLDRLFEMAVLGLGEVSLLTWVLRTTRLSLELGLALRSPVKSYKSDFYGELAALVVLCHVDCSQTLP